MSMSRLLPALLLVGGGGVALKGGGAVGTTVIDTVKTVMTRYELSEAARHLELDITLGERAPRSTRQLAKWLRDNHRARLARDPAEDLWQQPYVFRRGRKYRFALVSHGANGQRDRCAVANVEDDRRRLQRQTRRALSGKAREGDPPAKDDDICVWVRPDPGARHGRRIQRNHNRRARRSRR